jgi:hypothetical protein
MDSAKRNSIILLFLLLILPLPLLLQLHKKPEINDDITFSSSMQTIREEIEIIKGVISEVLIHVDTDPEPLIADFAHNPASTIPSNLRDPFRFPGTVKELETAVKAKTKAATAAKVKPVKPKPKPQLTLNGIIWDTENPMAIINGDIYKISDRIGDYTILTINEQGVRLRFGRENVFLQAPVIE